MFFVTVFSMFIRFVALKHVANAGANESLLKKKLLNVDTQTLNWLQKAMNTNDFKIVYKKGSEMPDDFLCWLAINYISWEISHIKKEQERDQIIKALKQFLLNRDLTKDPTCQQLVRQFIPKFFIENNLL